ncbi:hypothetical protein O4H50_12745 [Vibrio diazotrophicus]|uniref:hypothetical protein n=1 Tax=Vibrio diazotrophicus TaxID=685 RepID=UPI0022B06A1E|nr:hypothetical protein [Vibrio diazotrophicus]MCZ4372666.1 hypothetical protein [Vibrio diazotrophicus]
MIDLNRESNSSSDGSILLGALFFFVGLVHVFLLYSYSPDDTFIYLIYVKNLINGNGLSFNGELVEGFSSIIWVYLNYLFSWLPFDYLTISKLIGIIFYFIQGVFVLAILTVFFKKYDKRILVLLLLPYFSFNPLVVWSVSGLETVANSFLLLFCVFCYFYFRVVIGSKSYQGIIFLGCLFGLLAAMRPEGFAFLGAFFLFEVVLYLRERVINKKHIFLFLVGYSIVVFFIILWRYSVYSEFLPMTVLAKTGDLSSQIYSGKIYVKEFILDYWFFALLYVFSSISLFLCNKFEVRIWGVFSLIIVSGCFCFSIATGGDWMILYRLLVPTFPFMLSSIFISIFLIANKKIQVFLILLITSGFLIKSFFSYDLVMSRKGVYEAIQLGKYIRSLNLQKSETIAVVDAGAIPFYSELDTIDMVGLNNSKIGNLPGAFMRKYDNNYVLSERPKYIQMHTKIIGGYTIQSADFIGTVKLFYSEEFQKNYILDEQSPIPYLYVRREQPLDETFLDTFYEYDIKVKSLIEDNIKDFSIELCKTGDGVWDNSKWPSTMGSVFVSYKIFGDENKKVYESLLSLETPMKKNECQEFILKIPAVSPGNYEIVVNPVLHEVNDFDYSKSIPLKLELSLNYLFYGADMHSNTGGIINKSRVANDEVDHQDYIIYGPYIRLNEGDYNLDISYSSSEHNNAIVGVWDVGFSSDDGFNQLNKGNLVGSDGNVVHVLQSFNISKENKNESIEIRTYYKGIGDLTINSISIKPYNIDK